MLLGFKIANYLDLPVQSKQDILENFSLEDRTAKVLNVLETSISS